MKTTLYPTLEETLELHKSLIDRFGGKPGVRDLGLLESSLARPQSGYYATLSLQAAALLQSLMMNHAFNDGNKRVAFTLTAIFLRTNGFRIKVKAKTAEKFLIEEVIKKKADIEKISTWVEKHLVEVKK